VLPTGYPFTPPQVFLDIALHKNLIAQCSQYIGKMNLITIPYITNWGHHQSKQQSNLVEMLGYILSVMRQNPPVDNSPGQMHTNAQSFPQQYQQQQFPQQQQQFPQQQQQMPMNPYAQQMG